MTAVSPIERYTRFLVRHAVAFLVAVTTLTALLSAGISKLETNFDLEASLPENHPFIEVDRTIRERFGGRNTVMVAIVPHEGDVWRPEILRVVRDFTLAALRLEGIMAHSVVSLAAPGVRHVEDSGGALRMRIPATIRRDSTFEPEEGRREIVEAMLSYVVERAAARLRFHGANASSIEVRVRYVDTRTRIERSEAGAPAAALECRKPLPSPTDSTDELWQHARALFDAIPRRRALFKRVGLTLFGLRARSGWQGRLFSDPVGDRPGHNGPGHHGPGSRADRQRTLDRALDALRAKHGFGRLLRGTSLPLAETHELGPDGFRLRTPSLNQ